MEDYQPRQFSGRPYSGGRSVGYGGGGSYGGGGYGGGGGGGRGRYNDRRGGGRDSDEYRRGPPPKRKYEDGDEAGIKKQRSGYDEQDDVEQRLKSLIVRIGDKSTTSLEANLEGLANAVEGDLSKHRNLIVSTLFDCVVNLPTKAPVYATLVGLLNARNAEFGREIVTKSGVYIEEALQRKAVMSLKLLFRFLAELVNANVLQPASLLDLLTQLLEIANASTTFASSSSSVLSSSSSSSSASSPQELDRRDFFVHLVILTLPWAGKELSDQRGEEFLRILGNVDKYVHKRHRTINPLLCVLEEQEKEPDTLAHSWRCVKSLKENGWEIQAAFKPHAHFESKLRGSQQHSLSLKLIEIESSSSSVTPSSSLSAYSSSPYPHYNSPMFRIFPESAHEGMHVGDRWILSDYIADLSITFFASNKDLVVQLFSLPAPYSYEKVIVEAIFGQLFLLPSPSQKEIFYGFTMVNLCKASPQGIPPALAEAILFLFDHLSTMDPACVDRFSSWFAYHLSNFDYKWIWGEWEGVLTQDTEAPQISFVREVIRKEVNLSHNQRIQQSLPEPFHKLLPEAPEPVQLYEQSSAEWSAVHDILAKLRNRPTHEQLTAILETSESLSSFDASKRFEVYVYCVLRMGSKTFSHMCAMIERNLTFLRERAGSQDGKDIVLSTARKFWAKNPQGLVMLVERLLSSSIVDSASVVHLVFKELVAEFTMSHPWELLRSAIRRSLQKTHVAKEELQTAEQELAKVPEIDRTENIPEVKRVRDRREGVQAAAKEEKEFFLVVLQRFCMSLSEHLSGSGKSERDSWYHSTQGHLIDIARMYYKDVVPMLSTLESHWLHQLPSLKQFFQHLREL